ncbi:MAG TPA: type II toxin-antitoxin system prevent-host-death family antitoxin [Xanthobacteraceae bacterium]|nr:type II toxin-antitoxin system prevent-host-death family antitoxin [Xanthobacteraceae bacterium]
MVGVSAGDFGREVGKYQDMALTQPVIVTRNGRDRTVMISVEEYKRLKRRDRIVRTAAEFSPDELDAIALAEPPAEAAAFDHEYSPPR